MAGLAADALTLADKAQSPYRIVIPADAVPAERYAAAELQHYLEAMSGAKLPIVSDGEPRGDREIVLGASNRRIADLGLKPDSVRLGADGFWLKTASSALVVAGGRPRGTLYGVYTLLDDVLGVRWWTPDAELVPKVQSLTVPELDQVQTPAFEYREVYWRAVTQNPIFAARQRLNAGLTAEQGGAAFICYPSCHSLDELIPRTLFTNHPEYFPLIRGQRQTGYTQRCLSNPAVVALAIATVRRWIHEHPEAAIISVTQNDNGEYCRCPTCRALDDAEGSPAASFIQFVNAIAEDIERDYPQLWIDTFAYQYTRTPPKTIRPRRNVVVRLCSIECCFAHPFDRCTSEENRRFVADAAIWQHIATKLYVWDYTTNFRHYQQPFPDLGVLQPNLRFFRDHGVKGVFEQGNYTSKLGELEGLRSYLLAKLLWDPEADVARHTREFLKGYYGAAAPGIQTYLDRLQAQVEPAGCHAHIYDAPPTPGRRLAAGVVGTFSETYHYSTARYLTPAFLAEADQVLAQAEATADNETVRLRVRVVRLPVWYAMLASRQVSGAAYTKLLADFVETLHRADITGLRERGGMDEELKEMGWEAAAPASAK